MNAADPTRKRASYAIPLLIAGAVLGATLTVSPALATRGNDEPESDVAVVKLDGHAMFRVAGTSALPAVERAARIAARIEALAHDRTFRTASLERVETELGTSILAGEQTVLTVVDADARVEGISRQQLAAIILARIREDIAAYRDARRPERLLAAALYCLGATAALAAAIGLVIWLVRRLDGLIDHRLRQRIQTLESQSFAIVRAERIRGALGGLAHGLRSFAIFILSLVYLHFVLSQFPATRLLAVNLADLVSGPLTTMGLAIVGTIPNLIFLVILYWIVRVVLRVVHLFFDGVERGSIALARFQPEWASPTYKLVRLALVAFGLIVAYPYIPGSQSAAFKGVSLFLGVVFSLGSSSAISNLIAGYLMTYRRAFRVGDRVQIGDVIGDVIEMRLQATYVRTLKNEEVTIPNSLIVNGQVINYSSLDRTHGLIVHTMVGIGYEVPWRQVEAMLLLAAERTPGILKDRRPFVLQRSLGDFAVNYELNAYCADAHAMMQLYTALHRNILDVFNEYGVQIMTPAYVSDTPELKVVPKTQWYAAPAVPEGKESERG
ncbi:MAG: mechanosensitive ion channel family protein [Candidatus Binatia bacterium]